MKVNPGKVLAARTNRAAQPQTERPKHWRQRAAAPPENDAGSKEHHADAEVLRLQRRRLPARAQVGEKIVAGGRVFREHFIRTVAVVTHRAG